MASEPRYLYLANHGRFVKLDTQNRQYIRVAQHDVNIGQVTKFAEIRAVIYPR